MRTNRSNARLLFVGGPFRAPYSDLEIGIERRAEARRGEREAGERQRVNNAITISSKAAA